MCAVPIDWKMLTSLRPKLKVDEDYFDRIIEMGKLQIKTEMNDKKVNAPSVTTRKFKNKAGVVETRFVTCGECMEEFCLGKSCGEFNYDMFTRVPIKVVPKKPNEGSSKSTTSIIAKLMGTDKDKTKKTPIKSKRRIKRRKSPTKKRDDDDG